jgi:outer membrane cobalamin receptor
MKHKLKRFCQKTALKLFKVVNPKPDISLDEYEKESMAICKELIHQEDSTLLISPISGKRYIESYDSQLFIIIELKQLTIVNHQYSYNINIWDKTYNRISNLFDIEVEKRREKMENEIRSNVKHSLSNIYKNLVHEKI